MKNKHSKQKKHKHNFPKKDWFNLSACSFFLKTKRNGVC